MDGVTRENFPAYAKASEDWRSDHNARDRGEARRWRAVAFASLATTMVATAVSAALWVKGPTGWIIQCDVAQGACAVLQRVETIEQPQVVKNRVLKEYVQMRQSWDEASANSAFGAVACLSDRDEQDRFASWYNDDQEAPQQKLSRKRGFRVAQATSDPIPVGSGRDGSQRVQVHYQFYDVIPNETARHEPQQAIATFTVRKARKTLCNLGTGMSITDYRTDLEGSKQ